MAAAIGAVQARSNGTGAVQMAAFATNPVNGDTVVVGYVHFSNGGAFPNAPTDTQGNTYIKLGELRGASDFSGVSYWYCPNVVGGANFKVTADCDGAQWACIAILLQGMDLASYNGDFTIHTGSGAGATVGPSSPAPKANSIFIAFCSALSGPNTDPSGWNAQGVNGYTAAMDVTAHQVLSSQVGQSAYLLASAVQTPLWNEAGGSIYTAAIASFAPLAPPTPTSVAPAQGNYLGGTPATLTGTNFISGATVTFGGVAATNVVVVSPTSITCTAPAGALGTAVITVITASGVGSLSASAWTYKKAPIPTGVGPSFGFVGDTNAITIHGSAFIAGATVDFDGTPATSVVVVDANTITCVAPAHATGVSVITVTNP